MEEIPYPYQTVRSIQEISEIKKLKPTGRIKLSHLSEKDWLKFTEDFAYNTNAIEGPSIDQQEAKNIIEKNEWPNKPKRKFQRHKAYQKQ
ncbi:hypothetical protein M1141_00915 [Candidatus Marsarchaeota archaeon]|nr:hypothetical protein [Candidatus Marsarchaeota archaeon]